ncbi:MAG: hypothetical protein ABI700_19985 [Chloroflexota bacterium]
MARLKRARPGDVAVFVTLLVALMMALNVSDWLRGGYGWRWLYDLVPLARLLPLILTTAVYLLGVWLLLRRTRRVSPLLMLWSIAGAVAIVLAGIGTRTDNVAYELFTRTASLLSSGQQYEAMHVDWAGGEWRQWTEVMARFGGHMNNIPPGPAVIYRLLSDLLDHFPALTVPIQNWLIGYQCSNYELLAYTSGQWASSLLGMLTPLWSALTVIPLYALAKRFVGDDARYCVIWWPLVPTIIGFAGSWNTVYPLVAVVVILLLVVGLESRRGQIALFASGLLFGCGLFINFALIPLPLLVGLCALGFVLLIRRQNIGRAILAGVWFGIGLLIPWLIFYLLSGETFVDLLRVSLDFHFGVDRPYWFWLGMHLWDWVLWTGIGFAVLGVIYLWRWRREHQSFDHFTLLTLALAATMLILIFSGTARGETGRVWSFFSPFLLIVGAGALRKLSAPRYGWLTVAQAVYMIALVASLNVMSSGLEAPPTAPQLATATPVDAAFGDSSGSFFRLTGWDAQVVGATLDLKLNWQGLQQENLPYWFGAVLVAPDGSSIGTKPWQPGGDSPYPTTCWATQSQIGDEVRLSLPANAASGDWWVSLAAYPGDNADTRLTVTQPGQAPDQQIGLGPIRVGG